MLLTKKKELFNYPARWWITNVYFWLDCDWIWSAIWKWISCVARWTRADWNMINDFTKSALSTNSNTWINTFATQTCSIAAAICVCCAFRSTSLVWISLIISSASTLLVDAFSIYSTRIFTAEISYNWCIFGYSFRFTLYKWISFEAVVTCTNWSMV